MNDQSSDDQTTKAAIFLLASRISFTGPLFPIKCAIQKCGISVPSDGSGDCFVKGAVAYRKQPLQKPA